MLWHRSLTGDLYHRSLTCGRHGRPARVCTGSDLEEWEVLDVLSRLIEKSLVVFTRYSIEKPT